MLKKIISLYVAVAVAVSACAAVCISTAVRVRAENRLKAERGVAAITEVYHDQAKEFMSPDEPSETDDITLRIRTERYNVTRAQIQYTTDEGASWQTVDMKFEKHDDTGYYDFFKGTIPAQSENTYYRFICGNDENRNSVFVDAKLEPDIVEHNTYSDCWLIIPGYSTPDWSKGALWYSILPDAYYNGDTSNDAIIADSNIVNSWNNVRINLTDKYGGDLAGIMQKIDHIKSLNPDAVYLNPIFKSYQNAGYGTVDYMQIDPSFGNEQTFIDFCDLFHDNGIKLMMDAVMTFTASDSLYFDSQGRYPLDGAYESKDSIYKQMYAYYKWPDTYMTAWAGAVLDLNNDYAKKFFYTTKESYLQHYSAAPYNIDAWRFDSGGHLWGMTDTGTLDSIDMMEDIRKYMKAQDAETLLLSENDSKAMNTGVWDSQWNIYFMQQMQRYAEGTTRETTLKTVLDNSIYKYARPLSLSLYNMISDHDSARINTGNTYMENACILIQMTFLGSPCIYYGEEIGLNADKDTGIGSTSSFYAMDWDEQNWDYGRYNLYRALSELRSEYSAVKTGAVRYLDIDSDRSIFSFGRFDDKGIVITVASQNDVVTETEINARLLGAKDGAVFTDWLTGAQYTVGSDGKFTASIIPGGSILVSGTKTSSYRGSFSVKKLSGAKAEVNVVDTASFSLSGKGQLGGKKDKLSWASVPTYGDAVLSAAFDCGSGSAVLGLRAGDNAKDAAYYVTVTDKKLTVTVREASGKAAKEVCTADAAGAVRIVRDGENHLSVYICTLSETGTPDGNWQLVEGSEQAVDLPYGIEAGFAPLSGSSVISHVDVSDFDGAMYYDSFNGSAFGALLSGTDAENISLADGKLTVDAKSELTVLSTRGLDDDWTFKTALDFSPGEGAYAGVICYGGDSQYVVTGRTTVDGKPVLFIGRTTDGELAIDYAVEDSSPEREVVLQLQRIGTQYSAIASNDGGNTWFAIGDDIFANYSDEWVGVYALGSGKATFDYVSFGDAINDQASFNTPRTPREIAVNYNTATGALVNSRYTAISGNWEYSNEGYYQTQSTGTAQLSVTNKRYGAVRINATLTPEDAGGSVGIGFGKSEYDSATGDGFYLSYTRSHILTLYKGGKKIAEVKATPKSGDALRVVVEAEVGAIRVYVGQESKNVFHLTDPGYQGGYVCYYTTDTAARIQNHSICNADASWNTLSGTVDGSVNVLNISATASTGAEVYGAATLMGVGVTDFITTARVSITDEVQGTSSPAAGILLGASSGRSAQGDGISVTLQKGGLLILAEGEKSLGEYRLPEETDSVRLMVVKQNGTYWVYADYSTEPVLEYSEDFARGGAYQLYTVSAKARFANVALEDITGISYTESPLYQRWMQKQMVTATTDSVYQEDFSSVYAWEHLTKYSEAAGKWVIQDGVLQCVEATAWTAGVTVSDRLFYDFDMSFKYRFDSSEGTWATLIFGKSALNDNHEHKGLSLMLSPTGSLFFYDGAAKKSLETYKIPDYKSGDWYEIRLVRIGSQVQAWYNGVPVLTATDEYHDEGFISFASGAVRYSVDDVVIRPIQ